MTDICAVGELASDKKSILSFDVREVVLSLHDKLIIGQLDLFDFRITQVGKTPDLQKLDSK